MHLRNKPPRSRACALYPSSWLPLRLFRHLYLPRRRLPLAIFTAPSRPLRPRHRPRLDPPHQHLRRPSLLSPPPSSTSEPEAQAKALNELNAALMKIAQQKRGKKYFFGDEEEDFGLVDVAIAPWAVRDFIVEEYRGFRREEFPGWKEWAEASEGRECVKRTTSASSTDISFAYCINALSAKLQHDSRLAKCSRPDRILAKGPRQVRRIQWHVLEERRAQSRWKGCQRGLGYPLRRVLKDETD